MTVTAPPGTAVATPVAASQPPLLTPDQVRDRVLTIMDESRNTFFERSETVLAIWLAILSRHHCFLLGSPGTGKTAITRDTFGRIVGAPYFEALLSKSRPAEAILGPFDLPRMQNQGDMVRRINGFLPTAVFAMLDEVGKMSSTLGHDLLSITNERVLHQVEGGRSWVDVPLSSFIGGSNELPTEEDEDAAAMFDRILIRVVVSPIVEAANWIKMLLGVRPSTRTTVDWESLEQVLKVEVPNVALPHDVLEALVKLKETMAADELVVGDRRWAQSMAVLRAHAWLQGRTEVNTDDVGVLRFTLWETPTQIKQIQRHAMSVSSPFAEAAFKLREKAEEILAEANDAKGLAADTRHAQAAKLNGDIAEVITDIDNLKQQALTAGASVVQIDEVSGLAREVHRRIMVELIGINPAAFTNAP